jgi:outer membrane protein assembly factor BamA
MRPAEMSLLEWSAEDSIRELANPSTKSAISHTFTSDTRDDPQTGTRGRLLKLTHVGAASHRLGGHELIPLSSCFVSLRVQRYDGLLIRRNMRAFLGRRRGSST